MQTHISHEITGELLAHLRFIPGVGTDATRVLTTGDGRLVARDSLAELLQGAAALVDTLNEEVDREVDANLTYAASAEISRRITHPTAGDETAPPSEPACELLIDRSAIHAAVCRQTDAWLLTTASDTHVGLRAAAVHELFRRHYRAAQILAHIVGDPS